MTNCQWQYEGFNWKITFQIVSIYLEMFLFLICNLYLKLLHTNENVGASTDVLVDYNWTFTFDYRDRKVDMHAWINENVFQKCHRSIAIKLTKA